MHYHNTMGIGGDTPIPIAPSIDPRHIGATKMREILERNTPPVAPPVAPPSDYGFVKVAAVVGVIGVLYLMLKD